MYKGDIVEVSAVVYTKQIGGKAFIKGKAFSEAYYSPENDFKGVPRPLMRLECEPWKGMIVGVSYRISGIYVRGSVHGDSYDNPGDLRMQKHHKVIMVIPLYTERWIEPVACLEEDINVKVN